MIVPTKVSDVTKGSVGQQTFLAKVAPDEPIFILRGRDALAARTIQAWIYLAQDNGVSKEKIECAQAHRDRFYEYAGTQEIKLPD